MKRIFALILALTMMVTAAAFASAETTMPIVEEPITMTMMIGLDTSRDTTRRTTRYSSTWRK